ncbi:hypothetical protein OK348_14635 [Flavobacterium sp. MXW15]|uniref:EF-hand domain-containing protein n=1 Tax=Xanthomonas chitinilytica TaxID=2989819 RepID=A0ABT3JYU1_9XANT|nr:EF-hand domain-containing protein [Xanthomonas sp. H13-6]MCW4456026.1 hypothetical protein [Flavobacterium sp. MXW15]MCW4473623.1 EF-hand domain-containing protein [Xanthomonas sp. H13-6]
MTLRNRNSLFALVAAAGAALAFPAMAQDAQQQAAEAQERAAQAQQTDAAAAQASEGGQTWASVDTDGNGSISKQEAQVNAGLSQVFDQADANGDGQLTPDEYKAFVDAQNN